ncbi:MAG: DUF2520 domain-containing protein [Acidobacteria bacterium]|nr:DUF2520 domain-containing protein [Acidobacteriota bacterium]
MRNISGAPYGYRVAVLGAGRVGRTLGYLLGQGRYSITAVLARTLPHARQAARFIGKGIPLDDVAALAHVEWDILLIATPDHALAPISHVLAGTRILWPAKSVVHCSGYHSSRVLAPLAGRGAAVASMHPLQTFARPREAIHQVRGSYFAIEGSGRGVRTARQMVRELGGKAIVIAPKNKALYHCAASMACGHVGGLIGLAVSLLGHIGIHESKAKALLHPLIAGTIHNLIRMPLAASITGPISRGDSETVRGHLSALSHVDAAATSVYKQIGLEILKRIEDGRLSAGEARALRRLLRAD